MPPARRLLILRHGETAQNRAGIWQGHLDVPLTDHGREQARAAGGAIAAYAPVRVVSSDLDRAAETARAVAGACGLDVERDPRWREFDVGQWTGLSTAEVIARHPEERRRALRGEEQRRGIDGEGPAQVRERVRPALDALVAGLPEGECAVIVSHGGTIRIIAGLLLGLDSVTMTRLFTVPSNCGWATIVCSGEAWRVESWNRTSGLST
jgi:broad specificity phosphatase PhoE